MKSKAITFWLAFFLGYFGIHRFYLGKPLTGVLWFFTSGLFGFGYILDVIFIAFDGVKDGNGMPLEQPGALHNIIIKVIAVLLVISIASFIYFVYQMAITQPNHPMFQELPSLPEAINV